MPSPKRPQDPDHNAFDLRAGFGGVPAWAGVNMMGSSTYPQAYQFRNLVNVRHHLLGLKDRGGMTKQNPTDIYTGTVDGIFDAGDIGAP